MCFITFNLRVIVVNSQNDWSQSFVFTVPGHYVGPGSIRWPYATPRSEKDNEDNIDSDTSPESEDTNTTAAAGITTTTTTTSTTASEDEDTDADPDAPPATTPDSPDNIHRPPEFDDSLIEIPISDKNPNPEESPRPDTGPRPDESARSDESPRPDESSRPDVSPRPDESSRPADKLNLDFNLNPDTHVRAHRYVNSSSVPEKEGKRIKKLIIPISGLDLISLLSKLRAENKNYSLQIITT